MDKKIKISFLLALLSFTQLCSSQILRTKNWHFGYNTSLRFEQDTVIVDTSAIHSDESCTSISDINGNLLLYSDGITVWNKNHKIIGNGSGLLGHQSSSQGSVLLPFENRDSVFYLFTTDYQGNSNGLRYSKIIYFGNDSFQIVSKNNLLNTSVSEPIGAIIHRDNIRQWIMVRQFNGYDYYAFLLGRDGVIDCPVISKSSLYIGKSTNPVSAQNQLAFSPKGDLFANCYYWHNKVDLFQFNKDNGKIHSGELLDNIRLPTGVSFSSNNEYLYIVERDYNLLQFKTKNYRNNQSYKDLFINSNVYGFKVALNLTIFDQLLTIQQGSQYYGRIASPNNPDSSCDYQIEGMPLGKAKWRYGLPNFNFSYFYTPSIDFSYDHNCSNNSYSFEATDTFHAHEFLWRFRSNKKQLEYSGKKVQVSLLDTGIWQVTLLGTGANQTDSVTKDIYVFDLIAENFLGKDTSVCVGASLTFELKTPKNMHCIHWMGQSGQDYENYHKESFKVDSTGTFTVKMTDKAFCTYYDTIKVYAFPLPEKPMISYTTGELAGTAKMGRYNWYLNDSFLLQTSEKSILPIKNGYYRLQYINEIGCEGPLSDSFWVGDVGIMHTNLTDVQIFPNPSKGFTTIYIQSERKKEFNFLFTDIYGKLIQSIPTQLKPGLNEITVNTLGFANGTYFITLHGAESKWVKKLMILKN